jgi:hypothetical protein
MTPVQPKAPLTLEQAQGILETLSLLNTDQHKASKLIIYDMGIALEPDSSTWRTLYSWGSSLKANAYYYAGFSGNAGSRELADLPPLMERVHEAFQGYEFDASEGRANKERLEMAKKANAGLSSLMQHEYLAVSNKAQLIEEAQGTVKKIIDFIRLFTDESKGLRESSQRDQKERLLVDQSREIATLTQSVKDKQLSIDLLLQVRQSKDQQIEALTKEVSQFRLMAQGIALKDMADLKALPLEILIGQIHACSGVLASRQSK